MADIFEVTESMPVTLAGAFTMADIEGSFRTLAAQAGAVRDHPSTDPIRDGYVLAMLTWADIYAKYGPALESVEPAAEDIEAFVNENAAITEAVAEIDAMLFDGLDTTLRARGTAGGDYLADMFGPIDDYSMIMTELTTFEVVRPSEEILLFERLVDGNQVALLALEELAPPAHLEDLHFQQVDLLADTLAVFEDFRALVAAREEPGAAEFLALGAIQRDGLALREVRSAAVTAELRGEVR